MSKTFNVYFHEVPRSYDKEVQIVVLYDTWHLDNTTVFLFTKCVPMEGAPPVANQIDLFMHFLGASRDGLVARRVDLATISSSVILLNMWHLDNTTFFSFPKRVILKR